MSKYVNNQIPWFATSNGVIDLQTSADHRDHRYTHNQLEDRPPAEAVKESNNNHSSSARSKSSLKLSSNVASTKVTEGGLPPLTSNKGRPFSSAQSTEIKDYPPNKVPPAPKDNELYGDILVIPPIRQKEPFQNDKDFNIPAFKVNT